MFHNPAEDSHMAETSWGKSVCLLTESLPISTKTSLSSVETASQGFRDGGGNFNICIIFI